MRAGRAPAAPKQRRAPPVDSEGDQSDPKTPAFVRSGAAQRCKAAARGPARAPGPKFLKFRPSPPLLQHWRGKEQGSKNEGAGVATLSGVSFFRTPRAGVRGGG